MALMKWCINLHCTSRMTCDEILRRAVIERVHFTAVT